MGGWTCVYRGSRVSVDRALICPCHTVGHTVGSVWIMPLSALVTLWDSALICPCHTVGHIVGSVVNNALICRMTPRWWCGGVSHVGGGKDSIVDGDTQWCLSTLRAVSVLEYLHKQADFLAIVET